MAVPFDIPTNSVQWFKFLYILELFKNYHFLNISHLTKCEVIIGCGFDLCPQWLVMWRPFLCVYWPFVCLLWRNVIEIIKVSSTQSGYSEQYGILLFNAC